MGHHCTSDLGPPLLGCLSSLGPRSPLGPAHRTLVRQVLWKGVSRGVRSQGWGCSRLSCLVSVAGTQGWGGARFPL